MAEQDLDRNEAATPHKLQKARERGQVGKSADVVGAVVFTVAAAYFYWQGWDGLRAQFAYDQALLMQAGRMHADASSLWRLVSTMITSACAMLAPFLAALMLAAILANLFQTGPILSFDPIKPDFDRINPVNGFKRLFSKRTLFEAARALVKLLLLSVVVYHALKDMAPQLFRLASMPTVSIARFMLHDAASIGLKVALMLCLIGLADLAYTRREFAKKMRMSRRDIKDESKSREGDPRIRSRLRQLRFEALKRSMALKKTSTADVVLTNPTHYAVALRYVHGEMASPQLVAKGAGAQAAAMRAIAARKRIPVVPNPPLARELFHTIHIDHHVPPQLYAQVARILVWIFAMRQTGPQSTGAAA